MLRSQDEMHGLRKSMSAGAFPFSSSLLLSVSLSLYKHTAVELNSRASLQPDMSATNKRFSATFHNSCTKHHRGLLFFFFF